MKQSRTQAAEKKLVEVEAQLIREKAKVKALRKVVDTLLDS